VSNEHLYSAFASRRCLLRSLIQGFNQHDCENKMRWYTK